MTDPTKDHSRVSPEGRAIGAQWVRMVEPIITHLAAEGEPDERCKSCAFRLGTVPNGCLQTMADVTKAVLEQKPFACHVDRYADGTPKLCAGWLASQWGAADRPAIPHLPKSASDLQALVEQEAPATGWQPGLAITEEMHIAAVKVLQRAQGIDGLPQRMLDAMLSAARSGNLKGSAP